MLEKIEDRVIEKIESLSLRPKNKSLFVWQRFLLWSLIAAFLLLGGLSVSLVATILRFGDWDVYSRVTDSFAIFAILTFPYIWLIFFVIFIFLVFWEFRKTKHGYKYRFGLVVLSSCLIVIFLGGVFYVAGIGKKAENFLAENFSSYSRVNYMRGIWNSPEKGMISGKIISVDGKIIGLEDFSNKNWQINLLQAKISSMAEIAVGSKIKVIGSMDSNNSFVAEEIRPWKCGCPHCSGQSGESCSSCQHGECEKSDECQIERK